MLSICILLRYLEEYKSYDERSLGFLLAWLINTHHVNFYGMKLPTGDEQGGYMN